MSENVDQSMERIRSYCADLERIAFSIPAPNPLCSRLVSLAIFIRNEAEKVQAENFAIGEQWTEERNSMALLAKPLDASAKSPQ